MPTIERLTISIAPLIGVPNRAWPKMSPLISTIRPKIPMLLRPDESKSVPPGRRRGTVPRRPSSGAVSRSLAKIYTTIRLRAGAAMTAKTYLDQSRMILPPRLRTPSI